MFLLHLGHAFLCEVKTIYMYAIMIEDKKNNYEFKGYWDGNYVGLFGERKGKYFIKDTILKINKTKRTIYVTQEL